MLKKIVFTIGTRYLVAILNLLLIFINAKQLGLSGVGLAGVIIASVNILAVFNSILGGNTIVYFMSRFPLWAIVSSAYIWNIVGSSIACGLMYALGFLPTDYVWDIFSLAILFSMVNSHSRILLGKDNIRDFNATSLIQGVALFCSLIILYFIFHLSTVKGFLYGWYIANGLAYLTSLFFLLRQYKIKNKNSLQTQKETETSCCTTQKNHPPLLTMVKEMFIYGLWAGIDNLAETFTTRLNYYLLQRLGGLGAVGLLDAGTRISESVWHISRSVAFISYGEVSRSKDAVYNKEITLKLFKLTALALIIVMLAINSIPEFVFTKWLFTKEFEGISLVIMALSLGIITYGTNTILSHFFIGTGRVKISMFCSILGLIVLIIIGFITIPLYGVVGAAISCSAAYSTMLLFSIFSFMKITKAKFRDLLFSTSDFQYLIIYIKKVVTPQKGKTNS